MDNRAIGVFDSGLGGLTALRALRALLPEADVIYFADAGRVPYGGRSREQLRRMAAQDLDFLAGFGVKAILAACGTVSSNAPDLLAACPVPAFGVLTPGVEAMSRVPGDAPLGVIATEASIRSGSFEQALRRACPGREILALACPSFVPLIESGHVRPDDPLLRWSAERYLTPLRQAGAAAVLLGCTHYGIIAEAIQKELGDEVRLFAAADCGAAALAGHLRAQGLGGGQGRLRCYTSGSGEEFARAAELFLGEALKEPVMELPVMEL